MCTCMLMCMRMIHYSHTHRERLSYQGFVPGFAYGCKPGYETLVRKIHYSRTHHAILWYQGRVCGCIYNSLQPHAPRKTFVQGFRTRVCVRMQTRVRNHGTKTSRPHAPRKALEPGMRMWMRMWMHMWMRMCVMRIDLPTTCLHAHDLRLGAGVSLLRREGRTFL